jgi:hypothetical protein
MKHHTLRLLNRSWLYMILIVFSLFIIAFVLFAEFGMPYMPIVPVRNKSSVLPSAYSLKYEKLAIVVDTNMTLKGYFIHAVSAPKATIILLHGISSNKENWLGYAHLLAQNGFNLRKIGRVKNY